jgi:nucleoside-diphosphate-sugar epimerase
MSEHHWLMNRTYKDKRILVTGAGGFIGGWLTRDLLNMEPKSIRAVDIKSINTWYQQFNEVESLSLDLRDSYSCKQVMKDVDIVFNLAADMGGMGFIENNKAQCMLSVLINSNLLYQGLESSVSKYFFASFKDILVTED